MVVRHAETVAWDDITAQTRATLSLIFDGFIPTLSDILTRVTGHASEVKCRVKGSRERS